MNVMESARRVVLSLIFGVCLLGLPPAGRSAEPGDNVRFVMADVVKLREAPSGDAAVLANLRINTSVTVAAGTASADGWSRVSLDTEPPLTGYVASAFLSAEPQTVEALLVQYADRLRPGDLNGAKAMAERLVALEPQSLDHWNLLKSVYERLGDAAGVERVDGHLRGDGTKFLAYCATSSQGSSNHNPRVILLAAHRPGHGLTPWLATIREIGGGYQTLDERISAESLARARLSLQGVPWFYLETLDWLGPSSWRAPHTMGGTPRAGTPFAAASIVPPSPIIPGNIDGEKLVLNGRCDTVGAVLSNEPLGDVQSELIDWPTIAELVPAIPGIGQSDVHSVRVRRILNGGPLISMEVDIGYTGNTFIWALFDGSTGELIMSVGFANDGHFDLVSRVTWFTWPLSGDRVAIVEHVHNTEKAIDGVRIDVLVLDGENNFDMLTMAPDWYANP